MPTPLIPDGLRDRMVQELLESFKNVPRWKAVSPAKLTPVYDPEGNHAYYEVALYDAARGNAGYILIGATEEELPVVEFSETSTAPSARFAAKLGNKDFRIVYFGPGYIAAEDANGNLL